MEYGLENLFNTSSKEQKYLKLKVPANSLKKIFEELSLTFKGSVFSKSLEIVFEDDKLTFRASTAINYKREIELSDEQIIQKDFDDSLKSSYLYEDIEKLLPGTGLVDIEMTTNFIKLSSKISKITLLSSMSEIMEVDYDRGNFEEIDLIPINRTLEAIFTMTSLSKYFRKSPPIQFRGKYMQMQYNSLYIQGPSSTLFATIDYNIIALVRKMIMKEGKEYEFAMHDLELIFRNENKAVSLITSPMLDVEDFNTYIEGYKFLGEVNYSYLFTKLKGFQTSTGEGEVSIKMFEKHIEIGKNLNGNTLNIIVGADEEKPLLLLEFQYRLELFTPIIGYLGDSFEIYVGPNIVCLKSGERIVIFSYRH